MLFLAVVSIAVFLYFTKSSAHWKKVTRIDLAAIYKELKDNHPGYHDDQDRSFKDWLENGYQVSLKKVDTVSSLSDYAYVLLFFLNGFHDGHTGLMLNKALPMYWPRFTIAYKNGTFVVAESDLASLPCNAELVLCDSLSPRQWLMSYSFPYVGNPDLEASWISQTYRLAIWQGSAFVPRPSTYEFKRGTENITINPSWELLPLEKRTLIDRSRGIMENQAYNVDEWAPSKIWITLPSFCPKQEGALSLNKIIETIHQYAQYKQIVFDLRGNGGGNSDYGTSIIKNLYGASYYSQQMAEADKGVHTFLDWRASEQNKEYLQVLQKKLLACPFAQNGLHIVTSVIKGMEQALKEGAPFYKEELQKWRKPLSHIQNPVKARIVVLTDNYCASACLDFLDELFAMGQVVQVGLPTSADTDYMEIRSIELPSQLAKVYFPIKVYRGRIRKANQAYIPQFRWDGCISDTQGLQKWIAGLADALFV